MGNKTGQGAAEKLAEPIAKTRRTRKCFKFAEENGLMKPEELAQARKFMGKPGGKGWNAGPTARIPTTWMLA